MKDYRPTLTPEDLFDWHVHMMRQMPPMPPSPHIEQLWKDLKQRLYGRHRTVERNLRSLRHLDSHRQRMAKVRARQMVEG